MARSGTRSENRREAETLAAAARVRIVRQAAGLEEPEPARMLGTEKEKRKAVPTLQEFQSTFVEWVSITQSEQKGTLKFSQENDRKLLGYGPGGESSPRRDQSSSHRGLQGLGLKAWWTPAPWPADASGKDHREPYLATLRKALRYAHRKLKLLQPRVFSSTAISKANSQYPIGVRDAHARSRKVDGHHRRGLVKFPKG